MVEQLRKVRLRLAEPKSRLHACREGIPFCGFRMRPSLQPRILGATKRRFEKRRYDLYAKGMRGRELTLRIFSWYQFSREGNTEGLRRAYVRWPLDRRLKRRRGQTSGVAGRVVEQ